MSTVLNMRGDGDTNDELKQLAEMSSGRGKGNKTGPMSNAHVMDWDPLHLGHPKVSMREVNLIDLGVQVFGLDEIEGGSLPVAIVVGGRRRTDDSCSHTGGQTRRGTCTPWRVGLLARRSGLTLLERGGGLEMSSLSLLWVGYRPLTPGPTEPRGEATG